MSHTTPDVPTFSTLQTKAEFVWFLFIGKFHRKCQLSENVQMWRTESFFFKNAIFVPFYPITFNQKLSFASLKKKLLRSRTMLIRTNGIISIPGLHPTDCILLDSKHFTLPKHKKIVSNFTECRRFSCTIHIVSCSLGALHGKKLEEKYIQSLWKSVFIRYGVTLTNMMNAEPLNRARFHHLAPWNASHNFKRISNWCGCSGRMNLTDFHFYSVLTNVVGALCVCATLSRSQ